MKDEEGIVAVVLILLLVGIIWGGIVILQAGVIMWGWNAFMPSIFKIQQVTFAQTLALMVLFQLVRGVVKVNVARKENQ